MTTAAAAAAATEMSSSSSSTTMMVITTVGAVLVIQLVWNFLQGQDRRRQQQQSSPSSSSLSSSIPWAPGAVPLLGHALLYKDDPAKFLVQTCQQVIASSQPDSSSSSSSSDAIFRLNLAGKNMIVACGPDLQRQIASMPESIMSARQAVADIGFEYMLGHVNVYEGTDYHKGIVKGIFHDSQKADSQVRMWLQSIRKTLDVEIKTRQEVDSVQKLDFFHTTRRVTLRSTVEVMIGEAFLDGWNDFDFVSEFMKFQDTLEDVTAKSVVLPRPLALVTMLWPFQRRREALQKTIEKRLRYVYENNHNNDDKKGFWLQSIEKDHDMATISELIVGLLFAAHKNPAIGAAQTFLLLNENASESELEECREEARMLLSSPCWSYVSPSQSSQKLASTTKLRRSCIESLRLTAHSIGGVRTAQQDVTVSVGSKTYKIPKGSSISLSHIVTHRDTSIWGNDASEFDISSSSRWNNSRRGDGVDLYRDEYKFTTFSHGVHVCPGQQLALLMLQLIVAVLLVEYDVTLPDDIPPLDFERATLAQRAKPVMVTICPASKKK